MVLDFVFDELCRLVDSETTRAVALGEESRRRFVGRETSTGDIVNSSSGEE